MFPNVPTLTRRQLFTVGAVAVSGFDLLPTVNPLRATAKEKVKPRGSADFCLFIFLYGGPSHLDSFDVKEGKWMPQDFDVRELVPGTRWPVGLFPKLGEKLNKFAIVRSLESWETEHERATYYLHAAHAISPARVAEIPAVGAIVAYEFRDRRKTDDFLPPFVSMNYGTNQVKQGLLDDTYCPLNLDTNNSDPAFIVNDQDRKRFDRRLKFLEAMSQAGASTIGAGTSAVAQINTFRGDALTIMKSAEIPKILKIEESDHKRYGASAFGDSCILARNILAADRGTRYVSLNHSFWDFHTNIYDKTQKTNQYTLSHEYDAAVAELLADMAATKMPDGRSLLERTLIVSMGEFGRTPGDLTPGKGRDHHRFAMSALFAGGGVLGGRALGQTDEQGAKVIKPGWGKKRSMYTEDVAATIYSALGIDWSKQITNTPSGRVFDYIEAMSGTNFLDVAEIETLFG